MLCCGLARLQHLPWPGLPDLLCCMTEHDPGPHRPAPLADPPSLQTLPDQKRPTVFRDSVSRQEGHDPMMLTQQRPGMQASLDRSR